MYISAFHIDGFGIFANTGCADLPPGLSIFFGENEAGKSTCLDFFRSMLTGYAKGGRSYEPLNGGSQGGYLLLQCEQPPHEIRLTRSPDKFGGLRLSASDGASLKNDVLEKILSRVDRDIYSRIFGFSLKELESLDKDGNSKIFDLLFGASFGPGLISPNQALAEIKKRMEQIYKPRGNQQSLSGALREFDKLKARTSLLLHEHSEFDALSQKLAQTTRHLADLRAQKKDLDEERRQLEIRLSQRQNWEQWRNLGIKIDRIESIPQSLPEDALTRLPVLQAASASATENYAAAQARLAGSESRLDAISVNPDLLAALPELKGLYELKGSYRQALSQLKAQKISLALAEEKLANILSQLGPDWTCERIRNTDRSLFAREDIAKQADALGHAAPSLRQATLDQEKADQAVTEIKNGLAQIETDLASLPAPTAILSDLERDELRNNKARLDEDNRNGPLRERAVEKAQSAFQRSLNQAQIFGENCHADIGHILANLESHQDEALKIAAEIRESREKADEAQSRIRKEEEEIAGLNGRIDDLRNSQRQAGGPTKEALDKKMSALRSLRGLSASIESETKRQKEFETRINAEKSAPKLNNWALITFAIIFLAAALGIFIANWFFAIQEVIITPDAIIPINLWAAYACLVCGVVLFAGGVSSYNPEQRRRKQEYASLLSRSGDCALHLAELGDQARQLCQTAGIDNLDPISLDAMELLIETEREQLFDKERSAREIDDIKTKLATAQGQVAILQAEFQQKEQEVQQARRRWHGLMQSLNINNIPSPESIGTVFARLEAVRIAETNLENARQEMDELWEDLHIVEQAIASMPAIKARLEEADGDLSLEEAIKQVLDSCQEAEQIQIKRQRLEADKEMLLSRLEGANKAREQATDRLTAASIAYDAAKEAWSDLLARLGLNPDMDPDTVKEAYKYMREALAGEEDIKKITADCDFSQEQIGALQDPLQQLLARLGLEPQQGANGPDWLASLDACLAEAEANKRQAEKVASIQEEIQSQKIDLETLAASRAEALRREAEFISLGGTDRADEFLRLAHLRNERRNLRSRQEDLEIILAQSSQGQALETYLASFENENRGQLEKRLAEIQESADRLQEEEREATGQEAILKEQTKALSTDTELAELRQQEEGLLATIKDETRKWSELALAEGLLREAKLIFEKERQPQIIRCASEIFASLTNGRWQGLSLNLETQGLTILPEHGEPVKPEVLSRGAQEQAYLALRLAYIKIRNETEESLPLIMDEVLVNFDPARAKSAASAFASLAENENQQILYFTCQPHIVKLLQETFASCGLYKIEKGAISSAQCAVS